MSIEHATGIIDIEREIEKRFIIGFRQVFVNSPLFQYNDNEKESKVVITPDFPIDDYDGKVPHIVVTGIGYSSSTDTGLSDGLNADLLGQGIINYGSEHYIRVNYSASFLCYGIYDNSRNLANELFYWVRVRARNYFSHKLKLNVRELSKQPTAPDKQFSQKIFRTSISISGMLELAMTETPYDYLGGGDKLGIPMDLASIKLEVNKN